jgi:hypothetical protein
MKPLQKNINYLTNQIIIFYVVEKKYKLSQIKKKQLKQKVNVL